MQHDIVIFSPHLDDAALNLSDHVYRWKKAGRTIEIVSVFTSFGRNIISEDAKKYTGIRGGSTVMFEQHRKNEDKRAMKLLGTGWQHLGFVDGGFRQQNATLIYKNFKSLFSGHISTRDKDVTSRLMNIMKDYINAHSVLIPLGVGNHADHLIVKKAAEKTFPHLKLQYYVEYPYALDLKNWRLTHAFQICLLRKSIAKYSMAKDSVLRCYSSQLPNLFSTTPNYREIVLYR